MPAAGGGGAALGGTARRPRRVVVITPPSAGPNAPVAVPGRRSVRRIQFEDDEADL